MRDGNEYKIVVACLIEVKNAFEKPASIHTCNLGKEVKGMTDFNKNSIQDCHTIVHSY